MAPPLRHQTAQQVVRTVKRLRGQASFRRILLEANSQGVITDHRTLRRYLDLLVLAGILKVSKRDVGSVYPQQLYTPAGPKPHIWTGLTALQLHGLNWEVPDDQLHQVETDLEAVVRARPFITGRGKKLIACLEDALVHEISQDASKRTGATELVTAVLATRTIDLPYLLRRADSLGLGRTIRRLFQKITETFTSLPGESEGTTFLATRSRFLKILSEYNSRGFLKLVEVPGRGRLGLNMAEELRPEQIVSAAGKQLGASG